MKKLIAMVGIVGLMAATQATAHPDHDAAPMSVKPVSLIAKSSASGATIQVTEAGKAVSTTGATGTLTLANAAGRQVLQLKPAGENVMEAKAASKIAAGTKAQASITFADQSMAVVDVTVN